MSLMFMDALYLLSESEKIFFRKRAVKLKIAQLFSREIVREKTKYLVYYWSLSLKQAPVMGSCRQEAMDSETMSKAALCR